MPGDLRDRLQQSLGSAYDLEGELGGGGMARVFVAEDTRLARKVVVKVLPPELAAEVSIERFRREIVFAARLQHPLIVPVLHAAEEGGLLYYTMPLVSGETLRARIQREGPLPVPDALRIIRDVSAALAFAHGHGIVHRDIKPENVLLTDAARDGGEYALVTDFGVARAVDAAATGSLNELTSTGIILGTPTYMAPEQVAASSQIDHRTDIYALGVLAYEMLTGRPPFAGLSAHAVLAAHLTREPEPITRVRPTVSSELDALVMRCLAKEPAGRVASASELRRAIDELLLRETGNAGLTIPRDAGSPKSGTRRPRFAATVGIAAAAVVVATALLWQGTRDGQRTRAPVAQRSVAVLPFVNASSDAENEYFSDGMTDELIDALTRVQGLRVPSRSSSFAFKGSQLGAQTIGDSLGVQLVLEGSVRRAGSQLRITTQLSRVDSGTVIWSGRYDRELRDVLSVQEEVARSILGALEATIGGDSLLAGANQHKEARSPLVRRRTRDHVAYDLYLRGRYFWNRRSRDGFSRAASYFEQAIARDSTFAAAWAGLADSYCILANFGFRPAREVCPRSALAADRALALDSTLAEAHASRGFVHLFYDWDIVAAERELLTAVRLDSTYTNSYLWLNHLAWARGDTNAAVAYSRKAVELEPLSLILNTRLGWALRRAGRLEDAERQLRYVLELDSTFADAWRHQSNVLLDQRRFDEAVAAMLRAEGRDWLGYCYARAGRRAEALAIARELEAKARTGWVAPLRMGFLYDALGDKDAALAWLNRAYDAREPDMIFLGLDPYITTLTDDPRFTALIRRVGIREISRSGR